MRLQMEGMYTGLVRNSTSHNQSHWDHYKQSVDVLEMY